eukprot:3315440-Pyramimonas_sp.AAC.1
MRNRTTECGPHEWFWKAECEGQQTHNSGHCGCVTRGHATRVLAHLATERKRQQRRRADPC